MYNYEEIKNTLTNAGIGEWRIYTPEEYLSNANDIGDRKTYSNLETIGAIHVFCNYLNDIFGYDRDSIEQALCGITQNSIGFDDFIPITDEVGIIGFSIVLDSVFIEVCDNNYEIVAYVKI